MHTSFCQTDWLCPVSKEELLELAFEQVEESSSGRILIGIAGSPGSGKTTLATDLVSDLNNKAPGIAVHLPMDGFHLANSTLDRLGIHDKKGSIDTFDGWGFVALLDRVLNESGHTVFAPSFHRKVDEGVAGEIAIEDHNKIVIVEGNYLLVPQEPWGGVRSRLAQSWFCSTPEEDRLSRLVDRHMRHGRSEDAARAWATEVDGTNALLIESTVTRADLVVSGTTGQILSK